MSLTVIGIMGLVILFVLMFLLRMPIAIAFLIPGLLGIWYVKGFQGGLSALGGISVSALSNYVWTTVPLFTLMAFLAGEGKLAEDFYEGVNKWVGHFRGGLAISTILGNTAFGACCGSNVAAGVAFTAMALPSMRKHNYADTLSLGSIASGSLLSLLIPPSMAFIIIGALTQTSIGALFISGIIPGLILTVLYIGVIYVLCLINPSLGPAGPRASWRERLMGGTGMWAFIIIFVVIIGGLFFGLFTPTEAGAAAVFVVIVLGLVRRKLSWQGFKTAAINTGTTTAMIGIMLVGTVVFNLFLTLTGAAPALTELVGGITQSPVGILFVMAALWLVLGTAMDVLAMTLLTVPILYPIAMHVGISPVHFAVVAAVATAAGEITPPVGIVLFAMSGSAKDIPLTTVFRAVGPFLVAIAVLLLLVIYFPQLSTFLPSIMMQ